MKHKALLITLTCMIFCAVCILCGKELFSVKDITVNYSIRTEQTEEILSLLEKYKDKSMFSLSTDEIKEEITKNRYLKVISVEKKFPNEIVVNLIERTEQYYYSNSNGVYYFDNEYFVIRREDLHNNDANQNVIQICLMNIDGSVIEVDCSLKTEFLLPNNINPQIDLCLLGLGELKEDVIKITVVYTSESGNYRIKIQLREGGTIEIRKAGSITKEKAQFGANFFLNLDESRKINGTVIVDVSDNGQIKASHTFVN